MPCAEPPLIARSVHWVLWHCSECACLCILLCALHMNMVGMHFELLQASNMVHSGMHKWGAAQ